MAAELIALDSSKQSAFTKAVKNIKKSIAAKQEQKDEEKKYVRGIILVEHLPYGFFEDGLDGYFSQFGKVLRTRLARSKKTGRPKGYAFVEFEFEEVARIAAEAMNNYLMFERLIKCKLLPTPSAKDCKKIFAGDFIREDNYPKLKRQKVMKERLAKPLNEEGEIKFRDSRLNKIVQHNKRLAELGIDYQFNAGVDKVIANQPKSPVKQVEVVEPSAFMEKAKSKLSPKVMRGRTRESEGFPKPTPATPPAGKIHRKSKSPAKRAEEEHSTFMEKVKPKFSPKVLRSRTRESEGFPKSSPLVNTATKKHRKSETPAKPTGEEHPTFMEKAKPKFSPKLLRSRTRKSEGFPKPSPPANTTRKNLRKSIK